MTEPERPILESYWVLPEHLLAGEYPGELDAERTRKRIDALIEAGFDMFMDLTNSNETWPYLNILREEAKIYEVEAVHLRFPIGDFGLPTSQQMNSILDSIDQNLQAGHKIYLHCWGGIGRTGTVVGCHQVERGYSATRALERIEELRRDSSKAGRRSPETAAQSDFVRKWPDTRA